MPQRPRLKPYTARGIGRVPCSHCGRPSVHQWQVCADGNQYRTACLPCDIELNRFALTFMRIPNAEALIEAYITKAYADAGLERPAAPHPDAPPDAP